MARIAGVDLPNKAVKIALTYIYGIGRYSAVEICEKTKIDPDATSIPFPTMIWRCCAIPSRRSTKLRDGFARKLP